MQLYAYMTLIYENMTKNSKYEGKMRFLSKNVLKKHFKISYQDLYDATKRYKNNIESIFR